MCKKNIYKIKLDTDIYTAILHKTKTEKYAQK